MMPETIDTVFTQQTGINLILYKFTRQKRHPLPLTRHLDNHVKIINNNEASEI